MVYPLLNLPFPLRSTVYPLLNLPFPLRRTVCLLLNQPFPLLSASSSDGAAKYVAVNPGARHEAPLPGYDHSVVMENLEPAPGTEGLTMLVPPVVSNELHHWNPEPVVLRGEDMLSSDYLRMAHDAATGGADAAEPDEARYVAINNGVRHEAPLPGYDRSIVIENADTV
uniref:Uncharacterized protein n=1 Tax=Anopheles melas TaxID=34690 RepID=A0A182THY8_9DIPT